MKTLLIQAAPWLQFIGLIVNTVAAALMGFYPPRVRQLMPDGSTIVTWVNRADPAKAGGGRRQVLLSRLGPWLLALGFVLQVPSAWLAIP